MVLSSLAIPSDPHLWRWMAFVDGENFTIRGQQLIAANGLKLSEGQYFKKDVFLWVPGAPPTRFISGSPDANLRVHGTRAYYYASTIGAEDEQEAVKLSLWQLGFSPEVFKRDRSTKKSKGVDIALAKDILSHAALNNYDVAVLVAGDADYLPLVTELKRLGKLVYVAFFVGDDLGLSAKLRMASDTFFPLNDFLLNGWKSLGESGGTAPPGRPS